MRGYPKFLNTKEDYLYVIKNFSKNEWEKDIKALLDNMEDWFFLKKLNKKEDGIENERFKIIESENAETKEKEYNQYELKSTGYIERLGFTKEELEYYLKGGE